MSTDRRIYVASLSDYNAGRLHGRWVDASQDAEAIQEEIADMLKESPEPVAEEYAIHDYEGFESIKLSEHEDIATVAELAAALDAHDGAFEVAYGNQHDIKRAIADCEDNYNGAWDSEEDFAENLYEDLGYLSNDNPLASYVDWERVARDLFMGDYWSGRDSSGQLHVFRNA